MIKILRSTLFWFHLVLGCVGGIIILLMSITGVLLTYERQMLAWLDRGSHQIKAAPDARPLPIETILDQLKPDAATTLTVRSSRQEPIEVNQGKKGVIYVDPYSGAVLGTPSKQGREFFQKLRGWHRWLAWEGDWRAWGKAITGACTLAFLGIALSGLYLWLQTRPIFWFRRGLSGKARDFNWHNAIGIWSAVPLIFIILSALPISYPWANQLIYQVTGTTMPANNAAPQPKGEPNPAGFNRMLAAAATQPGWQSISFRVSPGEEPISFTVDAGDGGQPQLKSTLRLDRQTAAVVSKETFSDFNLGRQIRSYSRFLHTGESLGLFGQTLAGLASAGAVVLVWTGIALSLRRFSSWRKRKTSRDVQSSPAQPQPYASAATQQ
jgi:uncharacterized iron-regulated membrane protein